MKERAWLAPLAAASAAGVLGAAGALFRRPWHDELYTLELARRPVADIFQALHLDSGPPGYYLLCHVLHLGGADSVVALRFLSVLLVMAAVAVLVVSCSGTRVRWAAAALVALHPLVLAAAADARPYAALMALAAGVLFVMTRPFSRATAPALALLLGTSCWIHSLGLILTGAVFLVALFFPEIARRRALAGSLGALLLQLPWLPVMLGQPAASLRWMAAGWESIPLWRRPLLPLLQPGPAALRTSFLDMASPPAALAIAGSLLWAGLVLLGLLGGRTARIAAGIWFATGAFLLLGTAALRPIYAPGQADKILVIFAIFVVAAAASRSRTVLAAILALALVGGWASAVTLGFWKASPPRPEDRAAEALSRLAAPGDLVLTTGWWLLGVRHGLGSRAQGLRWLTFPMETTLHPGWYDDETARAAVREIPALKRRIETALGNGHHVFLLRSPSLPSNRLLDELAGSTGLVPMAAQPPYWELWGRTDAAPAGG